MNQNTRMGPALKWRHHCLPLGERTHIMGIVNVTPDSFSDGGRFFRSTDAVAQARQLVADGADILDVGGESTRPFSDPVSESEEIRRVVPVIAALAESVQVPISVDTTKAEVARQALTAGASIINDVSALTADPEMAAVAAQAEVPVVLMHMKGTPRTMQADPEYVDLFGEIQAKLTDAAEMAIAAGVAPDRIILDPGIGFGKTIAHNLLLIKHLDRFVDMGYPVLAGPSRKMFIRRLVAVPPAEEAAVDDPIVETGTQAAIGAAIQAGATIVRVHDVARATATVRIMDALRHATLPEPPLAPTPNER